MDWQELVGKKVFLKTRTDHIYQGKVIEFEIDNNVSFITILDKYNKKVMFSVSEIVLIKEEN